MQRHSSNGGETWKRLSGNYHAAIHGVHHRGQVALLLRVLGYVPASSDILFYYGRD